jgi:hypothetical protein
MIRNTLGLDYERIMNTVRYEFYLSTLYRWCKAPILDKSLSLVHHMFRLWKVRRNLEFILSRQSP